MEKKVILIGFRTRDPSRLPVIPQGKLFPVISLYCILVSEAPGGSTNFPMFIVYVLGSVLTRINGMTKPRRIKWGIHVARVGLTVDLH
jgi:hypothetical protein